MCQMWKNIERRRKDSVDGVVKMQKNAKEAKVGKIVMFDVVLERKNVNTCSNS